LEAGGDDEDGAEMGVTRAAVADGFVAHAILLFRKGKRDKRGGQEFGVGARERVEGARANPQLNIANAEERAVDGRRWGLAQILSGSEQKEKAEGQHVGRGHGECGGKRMSGGPNLRQNGEGQGLHALRGRVRLRPCTEQGREANVKVAVLV
jgi:hypothetical protein